MKQQRTAFAANLITPRTLLVFTAGFLLAVLLARVMPGAGVFHPEGRILTIDTVITGSTGLEAGGILAIATEDLQSFGVSDDQWDPAILSRVKEKAPGPMMIPVRIKYVVPPDGGERVISIREPGSE